MEVVELRESDFFAAMKAIETSSTLITPSLVRTNRSQVDRFIRHSYVCVHRW